MAMAEVDLAIEKLGYMKEIILSKTKNKETNEVFVGRPNCFPIDIEKVMINFEILLKANTLDPRTT